MLAVNWRGLHGSFLRALWKRFRIWSIPVYIIVLLAALATVLKPIVFWQLPVWGTAASAAKFLQGSALIDTVAFIFEYLFGIYIQVYLITVCLAWVKGLSFGEVALFKFAMRRFSYVLKWAGIVLFVSILVVRLPLLLAYFMNLPDILDYLPLQRALMACFILAFSSVQISLVLHNENLREAIRSAFSFSPAQWLSVRLVPAHLRTAFFSADCGRRDCSRRDCRPRRGSVDVENDLCCDARLCHRLAAGELGLPFSAM